MKKKLTFWTIVFFLMGFGFFEAVRADEVLKETNISIWKTGGTPNTQRSPQLDLHVSVDTTGVLEVQYFVPNNHCSSIRIHFLVDGQEVVVSEWLGWPGHSEYGPLTTGLLDLGPVSHGQHVLTLSPEGRVGGCNSGSLRGWSGMALIVFSEFVDNRDDDPPRTKHKLSGNDAQNIEVNLSASDDGSGVDYTVYSINGSSWHEGTTFWIDLYTTESVQYYSVDNEGNKEHEKTITIDACEAQETSNGWIGQQQGDLDNYWYSALESYTVDIVLKYFTINSSQEKDVVFLVHTNAELELSNNVAPIRSFIMYKIKISRKGNPWWPFGKTVKEFTFLEVKYHKHYLYPPRTYYEFNADTNWVEWNKNNPKYDVWLFLGSRDSYYQPFLNYKCDEPAMHKISIP